MARGWLLKPPPCKVATQYEHVYTWIAANTVNIAIGALEVDLASGSRMIRSEVHLLNIAFQIECHRQASKV